VAFYVVQHRYSAYRDGRRFGPWEGGETVDLEEVDADWINRDSAGCVEPARPKAKAEPAERQQPKAADRQHRGGSNRGAR
jgi:hypothetical protein